MFDDLINKFVKETIIIQAKDIFEDDKLLQAEKRLQKYMERKVRGYDFVLFSGLPFLYSWGCIYGYIEGGGIFFLFIGLALALVVLGLCYIGFQKLPRYKRFPLYLSSIADSKDGSLDKIADSVGYPYEVVVSDIEFLIQNNILEKTYVNKSKRIILSPLIGESVSKSSVTQNCPNCGASISFMGHSAECDYCGSNISLN